MARSLRAELATKSGHEFQSFFAALLAELMDGTTESKRLGRLDEMGIDAFLLKADNQTLHTVIQCKGFEVLEYGANQHRQCRREIEKYKTKGPNASEYWLVINRPIKDKAKREELQRYLDDLVKIGKVSKVELLDQEPLLKKLREITTSRLIVWTEAKRAELFEYYQNRMQFVRYIAQVPFNKAQVNPSTYVLNRLHKFFGGLAETQAGKQRHAPKILVTSEFGFGKTSLLQALARDWIDSGKHLIFVPAALLDHRAFRSTSDLASVLLAIILPQDIELSNLAHSEFRDELRYTLTTSKDWLVFIDGLDESEFAFGANSLAGLWGSIADLGIPAILSARDELVDFRLKEFFPNPELKSAPSFERIGLHDWDDALILQFVDLFAAARGGNEPDGYRAFRQLIASNRYSEIYGDIPKRPLFLGMLAEDAWTGSEPARHLHRLYGKYFRKKFELDRSGLSATGVQSRPSAIVDALGQDEAVERLIHVMQDAADLMLEITDLPGGRSAIHRDTIAERQLREIATKHGILSARIEDVAMHSLLQPGGRDPVTRERVIRFAHRSFQDWFLARQFASQSREFNYGLPNATLRFLTAMRDDLANGGSLP